MPLAARAVDMLLCDSSTLVSTRSAHDQHTVSTRSAHGRHAVGRPEPCDLSTLAPVTPTTTTTTTTSPMALRVSRLRELPRTRTHAHGDGVGTRACVRRSTHDPTVHMPFVGVCAAEYCPDLPLGCGQPHAPLPRRVEQVRLVLEVERVREVGAEHRRAVGPQGGGCTGLARGARVGGSRAFSRAVGHGHGQQQNEARRHGEAARGSETRGLPRVAEGLVPSLPHWKRRRAEKKPRGFSLR